MKKNNIINLIMSSKILTLEDKKNILLRRKEQVLDRATGEEFCWSDDKIELYDLPLQRIFDQVHEINSALASLGGNNEKTKKK